MYTYFSLKAPRCILCFVDHLFVNFVGQSAMFVESTLHTSVSKAMSRSERMSKKPRVAAEILSSRFGTVMIRWSCRDVFTLNGW